MSSDSIARRTQLPSPATTKSTHSLGATMMKYLSTTDHKVLGNMYFVTAMSVSYTHLTLPTILLV